jgi:Cu/Zn superoxide dismutase
LTVKLKSPITIEIEVHWTNKLDRMKLCLSLIFLFTTFLTCFGQKGVVYLNGTAGNTGISGIINLSYNSTDFLTTISGTISGLAADSTHGFHIHQYGDISKTDGTATGGHYNPLSGVHGSLTQNNSHVGDLVFFSFFNSGKHHIKRRRCRNFHYCFKQS